MWLKSILFALSGSLSMGGTIIFDYQNSFPSTEVLYSPDVTGATLTSQTFTGVSEQKTDYSTTYMNSFLHPNVNVGNGNTWSVTLSFTVSEEVTIDSINLNLFTYNGSGLTQASNRQGVYTFSLKQGDEVLADCSNTVTYVGTTGTGVSSDVASVEMLGTTSSGVSETNNLSEQVTLSAGETYSIELSLDKGTETNGYFVGLGAIELNVVPEPATATLGLLGLAGLAMRRRRKQ